MDFYQNSIFHPNLNGPLVKKLGQLLNFQIYPTVLPAFRELGTKLPSKKLDLPEGREFFLPKKLIKYM